MKKKRFLLILGVSALLTGCAPLRDAQRQTQMEQNTQKMASALISDTPEPLRAGYEELEKLNLSPKEKLTALKLACDTLDFLEARKGPEPMTALRHYFRDKTAALALDPAKEKDAQGTKEAILARHNASLNEIDAMVKHFEAAITLKPNDAETLNVYAYSLAEKNVQADKAVMLARQADKLQPNDGAILDTLGWCLYRQGKFDEAAEALEQAIQRYPQSDGTLAYHLGAAYLGAGKRIEGVTMLEKALRFELAPKDKANALKLLQEAQQKPLKPSPPDAALKA